jgi:hypothetical protein
MNTIRHLSLATLLVTLATPGWGQQADVRGTLEARGLPAQLVADVTAVAAEATAQGLPADPLVDKAIEGWAKRVPAPRILAVIRQFRLQLFDARHAVVGDGVGEPLGTVVSAAAEAMGRGITAEQVGTVVRAAPRPESSAPGLRVAAALTAQGLSSDQAVAVVIEAMQRGQTDAQLLDLPSVARAMHARGLGPAQIGQQMMGGGAQGIGRGLGARPPDVPPGLGPPPGKGNQNSSKRP